MATLDEEWLKDALPNALELCEKWDELDAIKEQDTLAVILDAKSIMLHAAGEIRAQRILISNLRKRIDELELEIERLHEPDDDRPDW